MVLPQNQSPLSWPRYNDRTANNLVLLLFIGTGDPDYVGQIYSFPTQPANSENGSGVKKLGALVDYNDSDSDEGKLTFYICVNVKFHLKY